MDIGIVGLGKMGANMTRRLLARGHRVVVNDLDAAAVTALADEGATGAATVAELVAALPSPRLVWLMVPSGEPTRALLRELESLDAGDIVVDGANSDWRDDAGHAERLGTAGIRFVDVGVSGGVWGLENGYCLMVGGPADAVAGIEPVLTDLAPEDGWAHVGDHGAGHYVKMVHNAIEYGMMESIAEGFELLNSAQFDFDMPQVAGLWRQGSVVRSWLLDLAERALADDPQLEGLRGHVADSGECRWAVETAIAQDVPAFVLASSLFTRFRSRQEDSFAMRLVAALRNQFGGHAVVANETGEGGPQ